MFLFLEFGIPYLVVFVAGTLLGYSFPKPSDDHDGNKQ